MDVLTRRKFLRASGVAGAGALAGGMSGMGLAQLLRTAMGTSVEDDMDKLIVVTLYGGNDGLNTVIPYADPAYYSARPELAYPAEEALPLTDALGLNRTMTGFKRLWDEKRLAIVLGVGYPKPDLSHFRSMDIWQTASPGRPIHTGWVGRWLDHTKAVPETAVSFEPVLPPLLAGETRAGACVSAGGLRIPAGIDTETIAAMGRSMPDEPELQRRAAAANDDLLRVSRLVSEAAHAVEPSGVADQTAVPATDTGGATALATQLTMAAQCIEAGVPTRVYSVSLGGFDTHAKERAGQERLLKQLDGALAEFVNRLATTPAGRRVTVIVYSEFGRRVRANASDGTDHGTSGPLFVLGHRVAGGFYGEQPSLTHLDHGDLAVTTDFRDIYGTVLASVLQADPGRYLEGYEGQRLPLFTDV